jgi:Fe-S-cluster containining protein
MERVEDAIRRFSLEGEDSFETYACPLFEKEVGCLVHAVKPVPCVQHACYERAEEMPPDALADDTEIELDRLTRRTYGKSLPSYPIPVALKAVLNED